MPDETLNRHRFALYIADGESGTKITIIGDPESGYSARNFDPLTDDDLSVVHVRLHK